MLLDDKGLYKSVDEMVSHPSHYQSKTGLEVIDVIEAFTDGLNGVEATDTGNIIKYACRWKDKNGVQDLEKILWYTQHLINHIKSDKIEPKEICRGIGKSFEIAVDDYMLEEFVMCVNDDEKGLFKNNVMSVTKDFPTNKTVFTISSDIFDFVKDKIEKSGLKKHIEL